MLRRLWQAPRFVTIRSGQWYSSHDNSKCPEEREMPEEWSVRLLEYLHMEDIYNLIPNLWNELPILISAKENGQNKNQPRL